MYLFTGHKTSCESNLCYEIWLVIGEVSFHIPFHGLLWGSRAVVCTCGAHFTWQWSLRPRTFPWAIFMPVERSTSCEVLCKGPLGLKKQSIDLGNLGLGQIHLYYHPPGQWRGLWAVKGSLKGVPSQKFMETFFWVPLRTFKSQLLISTKGSVWLQIIES